MPPLQKNSKPQPLVYGLVDHAIFMAVITSFMNFCFRQKKKQQQQKTTTMIGHCYVTFWGLNTFSLPIGGEVLLSNNSFQVARVSGSSYLCTVVHTTGEKHCDSVSWDLLFS